MLKEGYVQVEGGQIWYEVSGTGNGTPLIALHGGPGGAHLSMEPLRALGDKRPVILYDQLGCGNSSRPTDLSLWQIHHFVRELADLRHALGLEHVHLLGHSWGTMLLADYLLTQPAGITSAIFSSPCLSALMWMKDAKRFRRELPEDVQSVLNECEAQGTTDSEAYKKATEVYSKKHICRVEVSAEQRAKRKAAFGEAVYNAMWGPSEFFTTGNLKDYDRTQQLHEITVPTLYTCGFYDEATPESTGYYHSLTPRSKFHVMENCSHSPLREQPDEYLRVIREFLRSVEK